MILSREAMTQAVFQGGTFQRNIPDTKDMYGWVCGHLNDDDARPTLKYSQLIVSGKKYRRIFERGKIYSLAEGYGMPVIGYAKCTLIHRGKWIDAGTSYWVIHFKLEASK